MSLTSVSSEMLKQFSGGVTIDPGFDAVLKTGSGGEISVAVCEEFFWVFNGVLQWLVSAWEK